MFGLVEAGGTKMVLGIATTPDDRRATHRIPTTNPDETLYAIIDWFRGVSGIHGPLSAIGVASFGPLDLDRRSPTWGHITRTTKPHWSNTDFAGPLGKAFGCPVGFDTDVNGAALAEARWGAGQDQRVVLYLTVGTGIGGGAIIDGQVLRGLSHPEMGHIRVPRHPDDLDFKGVCPFHGDCLEGLASGPAIKARWGSSLSVLGPEHPANALISFYLAQAVCNFQAILEPDRIILGGGVMGTPGLVERVRSVAARLGNNYFVGEPEGIVVQPGLGDRSGLLGAFALAETALHDA